MSIKKSLAQNFQNLREQRPKL
jgi:hypothetical protein